MGKTSLQPFKIGNSRNIEVIVRDKDTKTPIDISGDKFYFTVKDHPDHDDTDAVVQASVTAPGDANSVNGIAIIPVSSVDTSNVEAGNYYYDISWLKLTSNPGQKVTVEQGKVGFSHPITRAAS